MSRTLKGLPAELRTGGRQRPVEGGWTARPQAPRSRLGPFGEGVYELVRQLEPGEQDALLSRGGHGFLVRLGSDGMPEAALMFDPDAPEARRLLRYAPLRGERLA